MAERSAVLRGQWGEALAQRFDLILSNPPYIRSGDIAALTSEVRDHDPRAALDGGPDGLAAYRAIAADLSRLCAPDGVALLEIGFDQAESAADCFREAGWTKEQLVARLNELLQIPGAEIVRGAGGIAEGVPETLAGATLPKFRPGGLRIVHCGGTAGLFSMMIGGWASGAIGSEPVMKEIRP